MKLITSLLSLLLIFSHLAQAQTPSFTANDIVPENEDYFRYGVNPGYYPNWGNHDTIIANIAAGNPIIGVEGAGVTAFRPTLPEWFVNGFGYGIRLYAFEHYEQLGMSNHTVFVQGPVEEHRDMTEYCMGSPSELFSNSYLDIWDGGANGTPINDANHYAVYMYNVVNTYKDYVRYWEIWNEPDLTSSLNSTADPSMPGSWWSTDPDPCDIAIKAPIQHYIRLLRISYEVIKALDPDAYVTTGGIGYPSFLHAILRNTDNPVDGSISPDYPLKGGAYFDVLSYHVYPHIDGCYRIGWNNDIGDFDYQRHSDAGAECLITNKMEFQEVLDEFGYDGTTYPEKRWIITETNVPRRGVTFGAENYGNDEIQRNWVIKAFVEAQANNIDQVHLFRLGETEDAATATYEFSLMGLYKNLNASTPYNQEYTDEGIALRTLSETLSGMRYDPIQTAALNLPTSIKGGAFINENGDYKYVLWAVITTDQSEQASASYSFPTSFSITSLTTFNWSSSIDGISTSVNPQNIQLSGEPLFLLPITNTDCSITAPFSILGGFDLCEGASTSLSLSMPFESYQWSTNETTASIEVNLPGQYCVIVTDANACTGEACVTINQIEPPVIEISGSSSFCEGESAVLTATDAYDFYFWSTNETTPTINVTSSGTYSVTVVDEFGCTNSANFTITASLPVNATISGPSVFCTGESVNLTATGGYASYEWSTTANTQAINISSPGIYSVTITNDVGCTDEASFTIFESSVVNPDISGPSGFCEGESVNLTATGGYASYEWSTTANTQAINVSSSGIYSVTITNDVGCTDEASFTITEYPAVNLQINGGTTICEGASTILDAGDAYTSYEWSTAETSSSIIVSTAGNYTVTVTDENNCTATSSQTVTLSNVIETLEEITLCYGEDYNGQAQFENQTSSTIYVGSTGCDSTHTINLTVIEEIELSLDAVLACDGSANISAVVQGGVGDYTYFWDTGETTPSLEDVFDGIYILEITDEMGCTTSESISISNPPFMASIQTVQNVSCHGGQDGQIELNVSGGLPPYTYTTEWSMGTSFPDFNNLSAGTYNISITDFKACQIELMTEVTAPDPLLIDVQSTPSTNNDGTASAIATGGVSPFTYLWNTGATTSSINELAAGDYTLTVTDANGCTNSMDVLVDMEVATQENSSIVDISIYPNPNKGDFILSIQLMETQALDITIINTLGKKVWEMQTNQQKIDQAIQLSTLPKGVYFIKIKIDQEYVLRKVMFL